MAGILKNRTDNDIKNKWNSMRRKEQRQIERLASAPVDVADPETWTTVSALQQLSFDASYDLSGFQSQAVQHAVSYDNESDNPLSQVYRSVDV
jgi:hypothetical protein